MQTQLNAIRRDMTEQRKDSRGLSPIWRGSFPVRSFTLEDIERFHQKLAKDSRRRICRNREGSAATFVLLNNEIVRIQEQITEIECAECFTGYSEGVCPYHYRIE